MVIVKPGVSHLSRESRVWIFQSSRYIDTDLSDVLVKELGDFLSTWAAHGAQLFSGFELKFGRFLIIAVDENHASATGCSIDKLMRFVQKIESQHGLDLLNRMQVAYRQDSEIMVCDVNEFRSLLTANKVNSETIVFNNLVQDMASYRASWEVPVKESWHANLLP